MHLVHFNWSFRSARPSSEHTSSSFLDMWCLKMLCSFWVAERNQLHVEFASKKDLMVELFRFQMMPEFGDGTIFFWSFFELFGVECLQISWFACWPGLHVFWCRFTGQRQPSIIAHLSHRFKAGAFQTEPPGPVCPKPERTGVFHHCPFSFSYHNCIRHFQRPF